MAPVQPEAGLRLFEEMSSTLKRAQYFQMSFILGSLFTTEALSSAQKLVPAP